MNIREFVGFPATVGIPLLQQLQNSTDSILTTRLYPLLIGILIALSAGVLGEGFHFLFKRFLTRPSRCEFLQPVIFGLEHDPAEAIYLLPLAFAVVPITQLDLDFGSDRKALE